MEKRGQEAGKKRRWRRILPAVLALLIVPGLDARLRVREYTVETGVLTQPVRLALVTDLHSCRYGEGEKTLLDALDAQAPDAVLLGGDIFDDVLDDDNTEAFLAGISGRYPVYYVTGNHEYWNGVYPQKMECLSRYEITRLAGSREVLSLPGGELTVCGVDDPECYTTGQRDGFEEQLAAVTPQGEGYTVLLSHRPERFADYTDAGFDLVLCGHAHGGQWRIPGLLNGLWAPDQGFFPKLAGGVYTQGDTTMIVSRGLARESTRIPRLYDPPELVIVTLT
ncbi:MAG: metallophosphoesterase [Oscillospiraceae bacterium]|nr:metallophosphoesterase [Oscillospiraceae bacterium]